MKYEDLYCNQKQNIEGGASKKGDVVVFFVGRILAVDSEYR